MAEEMKWKKWEGPGQPPGQGGVGASESAAQEEVEGKEGKPRTIMYTCWNCGAQNWVSPDWTYFTCWRCGNGSCGCTL